MAEIVKQGNVELLDGKVAVLGFGSQGHAHALNMADSGVEVVVGLRQGSRSWAAAEEAGLAVTTPAEAVKGAQLVAFLVPDGAQPAVYEEVAPNLEPGATLLFAHGFNVHYGRIAPPAGHDVVMVAPKGPGHVVRRHHRSDAALSIVGVRLCVLFLGNQRDIAKLRCLESERQAGDAASNHEHIGNGHVASLQGPPADGAR